MGKFYPPVLDNKATSIPYKATFFPTDTFDIYFQMPGMNDPVALQNYGHIQVIIKTQANNEPAVNNDLSPDKSVLYFNASAVAYFKDQGDGVWKISLPYKVFANNEGPKADTVYTIQVRFGDDQTWNPGNIEIDHPNFNLFSQWRQAQVTHIPSMFGEWSNVQTVYCYKPFTTNIDYNFNDFVPEVIFTYSTTGNDPISQMQIMYYYLTQDEVTVKQQTFDGVMANDNTYILKVKLPVAPWQTLNISMSGITTNNTSVGLILDIPPLTVSSIFPSLNGKIEDLEILGTEKEDGVIGKRFILPGFPSFPFTDYFNVYRVDLANFETVRIATDVQLLYESSICEIKDYSVEVGNHYRYVACGLNKDKIVIGFLETPPPLDSKYRYGGDARLTHMESSFLASRYHQLRLIGNMTVSNFKRNVADAFQTTIGDPYPFYQRNSKVNYRTLGISAALSINFDETATFIRLDSDSGLYWENDEIISGDKKLIDDRLTVLRIRLDGLEQQRQWLISSIDPTLPNYQEIIDGINQEYEQKMARVKFDMIIVKKNSILIVQDTDIFDEEQWSLSRRRTGKSKNIENPTIVDLGSEDPSSLDGPKSIFSPYLEKNENKLYGTSQTDSLVFVERKFREYAMKWLSNGKPKLFRSETEGNMIVIVSDVSFAPLESTQRMVYTMTATLTEIAEYNLDNLLEYNLLPIDITANYDYRNEYDFVPGDPDPNVHLVLTYLHSPVYDIPNTLVYHEITPINTYPAVQNGRGPFIFSEIQLPAGLNIDPHTGIISGAPSVPNNQSIGIIQVTDANGDTARMNIFVGHIYSQLVFVGNWSIPELTIGTAIIPIITSSGVSQGVPPYHWQSLDLPPGVMIDRNTGRISGAPTAPITPGFSIITVIDDVGQTASVQIPYNTTVYPIRFVYSPAFNFNYLEVGTLMPNNSTNPTWLMAYNVSGGWPINQPAPGNYSYTATGLPPGLTCNPLTGVISGTPNTVSSGGQIVITATDSRSNSASITIIYRAVLAKFTFTWNVKYDIFSALGTPIPWGTVLPPINLMDPTVATTGLPAVVGGLPFTTGAPYKFTVDKNTPLRPNYDISSAGVITGKAQVSKALTTSILYATDARGITIQISQPITIDGINNSLRFRDSSNFDLPPMVVGVHPANYSFYNLSGYVVDGQPVVEGGTGIYTFFSEAATSLYALPPGIEITPAGLVKITNTGPGPTTASPARIARIWVQDTTSPTPMQAMITINVGAIGNILQWAYLSPQYNIPDMQTNNQIIAISTSGTVSGGVPPYSYEADNDLFPYYIDESGPQGGTIRGNSGTAIRAARTSTLTVHDDLGQSATITINVGRTYAGMQIIFENSLEDIPLIRGVSIIPAGTRIISATGGESPYTFSINWPSGTQPVPGNPNAICPGIILDPSTGCISGTPLTTYDYRNIANYFVVTDSAGHSIQAAGKQWGTPNVYNPISRWDDQPFTNVIEINTLQTGIYWTAGVAYLNLNNFPYGSQIPGTLPPGIGFVNFVLQGAPTAASPEFLTTITASTPSNIFTVGQSVTVDVKFLGIVSNLIYIASPSTLNVPIIINGVPMTPLDIGLGVSGGKSPYFFDLPTPSQLPNLITLSTAGIISGTSPLGTLKDSDFLTLRVKDSSQPQQVKTITIPTNGCYDPLTYTYNAAYNILSYPVGTVIPSINTATAVAGGRSPYTYSADYNLTPYNFNSTTGVISGNSGQSSYNERIAQLTVSDINGSSASMNITVGKIIGPLSLQPTPDQDIPAYQTGQSIVAIDMKTVTSGGTGSYSYTGIGFPTGIVITTAGIIQGIPVDPTDQGFATITVTDALGATSTAQIHFDEIHGPLQFIYDSTFDIPSVPTNTLIPLINVSTGVAGGVGPYTFSASASLAPYTINSNGYISGTSPASAAAEKSAVITVTDSEGTPASITITIKKVYAPLVITLSGSMQGKNLLQNVGSTVASNIGSRLVIKATGGSSPNADPPIYTYRIVSGQTTTQTVIPGITLNASTGNISGRATELGTSVNIGPMFIVYDNDGHSAQAPATAVWWTPNVIEDVKAADGQALDVMRTIRWLYIGTAFTSDQYLIGGLPTATTSVTLGTPIPGISMNTAGRLSGTPTGSPSGTSVGNNPTTGMNTVIQITRVSNADGEYNNARTVTIPVEFLGTVAPFTFNWNSARPALTYGVFLSDTTYTVDLLYGSTGGLRPLTFNKSGGTARWTYQMNGTERTGRILMNAQYQTTADAGTISFNIQDGLNTAVNQTWNYPRTVKTLRDATTTNTGASVGPGVGGYVTIYAAGTYTGGETPITYANSTNTSGTNTTSGQSSLYLQSYGSSSYTPYQYSTTRTGYVLVTDNVGQTVTPAFYGTAYGYF